MCPALPGRSRSGEFRRVPEGSGGFQWLSEGSRSGGFRWVPVGSGGIRRDPEGRSRSGGVQRGVSNIPVALVGPKMCNL